MLTYVARRLLALIPLLLIVSFLVFSLIALVPGDPAVTIAGGTSATPERIDAVRQELHLDDGLLSQYWRWLTSALQGDLGESLLDQQPVGEQLRQRLPVTASLVIGGEILGLLIAVPLGLLAATRPGGVRDRAVTGVASLAIAMPEFWLAMILVVVFAVNGVDLVFFQIKLPSGGYVGFSQDPYEWARHLILPWIAIGVGAGASLARQLRGSMVDTLDQDYIRTARAKGLRGRAVFMKHALKNASMPVMTILGIQVAYALGGAVILERIFRLPGIGTYALQAIGNQDLPVIQGVALLAAVVFVVLNLAVDIAYGFLNPKVRLS